MSGVVEQHHVKPKCLGGTDEPDNLVSLTPREHYVAHQLLVKMNPTHKGLVYAALLMTRKGRGKTRISNRMYGWLKEKFSLAQSELMKERLKLSPNPSTFPEVKKKRSKAWAGENNPSFQNPNMVIIKQMALAKLGVPHEEEHGQKISESITKWHKENPEKHPMKNPETVRKAVLGRKEAAARKKIVYWAA